MEKRGEIAIFMRDDMCRIVPVGGTVYIRSCCERGWADEQPIKEGHVQLRVLPGCYVVLIKPEEGMSQEKMVIVKCNETVCLNPLVKW
ncbi:MAG: hypothetical protein HXS46_15835 [Theionarchaea archaeon]|nr:MAG: hypothetical protein AYK18_02405 [Theionarchaea archaeon DG-70]MBU7012156.1 hypothetical protein [Theionarchaea archaeon]